MICRGRSLSALLVEVTRGQFAVLTPLSSLYSRGPHFTYSIVDQTSSLSLSSSFVCIFLLSVSPNSHSISFPLPRKPLCTPSYIVPGRRQRGGSMPSSVDFTHPTHPAAGVVCSIPPPPRLSGCLLLSSAEGYYPPPDFDFDNHYGRPVVVVVVVTVSYVYYPHHPCITHIVPPLGERETARRKCPIHHRSARECLPPLPSSI